MGGRRRQYFRLTAQTVRRATAPGLYADGACLYLLVGRTGSKSWVFRYRQDGRLRDMGLGPLHTVSLAEAREAALACRQLRRKGVDPIGARRAEKQQAQLERARAMTFEQCAKAYIADHEPGWKNAKHAAQWPSTLATYVYPIFGELPVAAIDPTLVLKVLEQPDACTPDDHTGLWRRKPETASRVRQRIEAILDWAKTAAIATVKTRRAGTAISNIRCRKKPRSGQSRTMLRCPTKNYRASWPRAARSEGDRGPCTRIHHPDRHADGGGDPGRTQRN